MTDLFVASRVEATAPWGLSPTPPVDDAVRVYAHFAYVVRGACNLILPTRPPIPLGPGDCLLLGPGTPHTLSDTDDETPTIIHGWYALDRASSRSALDLLPPLVAVVAQQRSPALAATLEALVSEIMSPGPGSHIVVTRLADIVFIQTLRAHIDAGGCTETPRFLKAVTDPQIGRSLKAMHDSVARPWTLSTLASTAGMSRSAFAPRFKALLGETPLEYLTRWRMQTAGRLLRDPKLKMRAVASSVGYRAEGAFTRAFRRVHGVGPSAYRRSIAVP